MIRTLGTLAVIATALVLPATASGDNTGPVRWEGATVTVEPSLLDAARAWETESLRFVPSDDAQITTSVKAQPDMVGGRAVKVERGGWIVGCNVETPKAHTDLGILIHEVGHCLGVTHQYKRSVKSIMAPWYDGHITGPTKADRATIEALY
jgi:hypothetical protein